VNGSPGTRRRAVPVRHVGDGGGRQAELLDEAAREVPGRRDEEVDVRGDLARVAHPARDPPLPVREVGRGIGGSAGVELRVAALRAPPVVLAVAACPQRAVVGGLRLQELPARAHEPVVVQREDHRDAASAGLEHDRRRQVVEVADVDNVGPQRPQQLGEPLVDAGLAVAVATPRRVDDVQGDALVVHVAFARHGEVRRERVLAAREDVHLVPPGQRPAQRLGVDLGPRVVARRVAVDDLQDPHGGLRVSGDQDRGPRRTTHSGRARRLFGALGQGQLLTPGGRLSR
jgi:hypothetical protein